MSVAAQLQSCLEAEGAVFHSSLRADALPAMGGGMGVIATHRIAAGETLAVLPFRSMVTVKKARFNLALAELAVTSVGQQDCGIAGDRTLLAALGVVPFTAHLWSEGERASAFGDVGATARSALEEKLRTLERDLSPTETITCYLVLMAALYGRWGCSEDNSATADGAVPATGSTADGAPRPQCASLRFSHENEWMGTWIRCLPAQYDNLLELDLHARDPAAGDEEEEDEEEEEGCAAGGDGHALQHFLWVPRHRAKVRLEQAELRRRYAHCVRVLGCLRCLPRGVEVGGAAPGSTAADRHVSASLVGEREGGCSLGQYLWAFNSLMSRGFGFDEDVWAMMPLVDYFNYALDANGTMYTRPLPQDVRDGRGRSSASTLRASSAYEFVFSATRAVAPGEQVLLHYGAYSDFELLMWYGFTLSPFLRPPATAVTAAAAAASMKVPRADEPVSPSPSRDDRGLLLLRLLQQTDIREQLFEAWQREQTPPADARADPYARGRWEAAWQRAGSHVLSCTADTDGNYPTPPAGGSWMGDLVAAYTRARSAARRRADSTETVERALDHLAQCVAEDWQAHTASWTKLLQSKGLLASPGKQPVSLGVLAPSPAMRDTVRQMATIARDSIARAAVRVPGAATVEAAALTDVQRDRVAMLRVLAWMELTLVARDPSSLHDADVLAVAPRKRERAQSAAVVFSRSAAAMAEALSRDAATLLRFLAAEATDTELHAYLCRQLQQ